MDGQQMNFPALKRIKLPVYSEREFSDAVNRILLHQQSKLKFQAILSSASGVVFSGNYSLGRISHNYFSACRFDGASLKNVAGAGSIFTDTQFIKSELDSATFQSSSFETCRFKNSTLEGCNLSECYFHETTWEDCPSGCGNMSFSLLKKCQFIRTKPGNLAEATLDDVYLEDIRLTNINLEFSSMQNIKTKNVVLAFSQLPYIFGGLKYILETSDSVRISSHINTLDSISVDEYIQVLRDMEIFYCYKKEYFPLANILLAFHRYNEALAAILCGIQESAIQGDFRMCKYYCKLITENGQFSCETLLQLYEAICRAASVHALADAQYYQYVKHMPEIRSMLVENPNGYPYAVLRLETGITNQESTQISPLLAGLDELLHLNGAALAGPNISISHNSPLVFVISLCGTPLTILAVATIVLTLISTVCKTYNDVAQAIISTQNINKNRRDKKRDELETKKLSAEIARLEAENAGLPTKIKVSQQRITESGIIVLRADLTGQDFDPMKWL